MTTRFHPTQQGDQTGAILPDYARLTKMSTHTGPIFSRVESGLIGSCRCIYVVLSITRIFEVASYRRVATREMDFTRQWRTHSLSPLPQ